MLRTLPSGANQSLHACGGSSRPVSHRQVTRTCHQDRRLLYTSQCLKGDAESVSSVRIDAQAVTARLAGFRMRAHAFVLGGLSCGYERVGARGREGLQSRIRMGVERGRNAFSPRVRGGLGRVRSRRPAISSRGRGAWGQSARSLPPSETAGPCRSIDSRPRPGPW